MRPLLGGADSSSFPTQPASSSPAFSTKWPAPDGTGNVDRAASITTPVTQAQSTGEKYRPPVALSEKLNNAPKFSRVSGKALVTKLSAQANKTGTAAKSKIGTRRPGSLRYKRTLATTP